MTVIIYAGINKKVLRESNAIESYYSSESSRYKTLYNSKKAEALACTNSLRPPGSDPIGDLIRREEGAISTDTRTGTGTIPVPTPAPRRIPVPKPNPKN